MKWLCIDSARCDDQSAGISSAPHPAVSRLLQGGYAKRARLWAAGGNAHRNVNNVRVGGSERDRPAGAGMRSATPRNRSVLLEIPPCYVHDGADRMECAD